MKLKFLGSALCSLALLLTNNANAGLIVDGTDTNIETFIDTSTNIEWMDFGVNNDLTFNEVKDELGKGGRYEGWQLASLSQVYEMFENAFFAFSEATTTKSHNGVDGHWKASHGKGEEGSVFKSLLNIMGYNEFYNFGVNDTGYDAYGLVEANGGLYALSFEYHTGENLSRFVQGSDLQYDDYAQVLKVRDSLASVRGSDISTLLVRTTEVSEPSAFAILAFGLMALFGNRRRKLS